MRRRLRLVPGVLLVLLALVAAGCGEGSGSAATLQSDQGDRGPGREEAPAGEELYRRHCASCHGQQGGGGFGPSLAGVADRLTSDEHVAVVRDGTGRMPSWEGSLSPEEIQAVVDYERTALSEPTSEQEERP